MEPRPRELKVYETSSGSAPFEDWLDNLRDARGRAVIRVRLDRLSQGLLGDSKSVNDGVQELKIDYGPGYRIYFAEDGPAIVLLLIGGDKDSQTKNIKLAKKFLEDYRRG